MGDHRASIKIEMTIHGKKYETDMWINYWPADDEGCDPRVSEWFAHCWTDAKARYDDEVFEAERAAREREEERRDRADYERLRAKFGGA